MALNGEISACLITISVDPITILGGSHHDLGELNHDLGEFTGDHPVGREREPRVYAQPVAVHSVDEHEEGEGHRESDRPGAQVNRRDERRLIAEMSGD